MRKKFGWLFVAAAGAGAGVAAARWLADRQVPTSAYLEHEGILVFAHRGGEGLWPPNTLYAFERAAQLGVDGLETDIHSTADGVLVLMHDDTVDQTTNGQGPIHSFTLQELKALDAGYTWTADGGQTFPYRGQGINVPTLEEVLKAFPTLRLNIDIKQQQPSIVEPFAEMLYQHEALDRVMVGSFHDRELAKFRLLCPEVPTAAGVAETRLLYGLTRTRLSRFFPAQAHAFQVPEYHGEIHLVTPAFIRAAHAHNIQVHVWTVNEAADMQRLIEWGVDGLMTDYPDRLLELLGRRAT